MNFPVIEYPIDGLETISHTDGPAKIVLGVTGIKDIGASLGEYTSLRFCPHFTVDVEAKVVYQHLDLDGAAPMFHIGDTLAPHRSTPSYWVLLNKRSGDNMSADKEEFVSSFGGGAA